MADEATPRSQDALERRIEVVERRLDAGLAGIRSRFVSMDRSFATAQIKQEFQTIGATALAVSAIDLSRPDRARTLRELQTKGKTAMQQLEEMRACQEDLGFSHDIYLPEFIRGKRILLMQSDPDAFLLDNAELQSATPGVYYRKSKDLDDRDEIYGIAKYGEVVRGVLTEGWLKVSSDSLALEAGKSPVPNMGKAFGPSAAQEDHDAHAMDEYRPKAPQHVVDLALVALERRVGELEGGTARTGVSDGSHLRGGSAVGASEVEALRLQLGALQASLERRFESTEAELRAMSSNGLQQRRQDYERFVEELRREFQDGLSASWHSATPTTTISPAVAAPPLAKHSKVEVPEVQTLTTRVMMNKIELAARLAMVESIVSQSNLVLLQPRLKRVEKSVEEISVKLSMQMTTKVHTSPSSSGGASVPRTA